MRSSGLKKAAVLAMAGVAAAFPGMNQTLIDLKKRQGQPSTSLIGDLQHLADKDLTRVGRDIKGILIGRDEGQDLWDRVGSVPPKNSDACARDTCCIWKYIADEMRAIMVGSAGRCNDFARAAIRLAFHDAGTWSRSQGRKGGADGSIVLARECEDREENGTLLSLCAQMRAWYSQYKDFGVSMADLIQMAATVGTVSCPLGPRIRSFVGRKDSSEPSPRGFLPSPFASADRMIALFEDKSITAAGLVALIGAHTASQQRLLQPDRAGDPQDSTPGVWDTRYFRETVSDAAPKRVLKFESDVNLAKDPRARDTWQSFSSPILGQIRWNQAYAREFVRLSLLGVYNINELTECTRVLPGFLGSFAAPDETQLQAFLDGRLDSAAGPLLRGDKIPEA